MLRHRLTLLFIDVFLIGISYLIIILIKGNPESYLTPRYVYGLLLFTFVWITVSSGLNKYYPKHPPWDSSTAQIFLVNLMVFGIIAIVMYGARSLEYSRLIIFGTIALLTFFEIVVNKIYRLVAQNGKGTFVTPKRRRKETSIVLEQANQRARQDVKTRERSISEGQLKLDIVEECGEAAYDYIAGQVNLLDSRNLVMSTTTRFNITYQPDNYLNGIINLKKVNDIRYINKFFETINSKLPEGGNYIGCSETKDLRKKRILKKYPPGLNWILYTFDYFIKRVLPKFNLTKNIYFFLSGGQNRVLTRAEILGRLYSCGFSVQNEEFVNGRYFFNVVKNGVPQYPENPTYGIFVRLPRVGKDGKILRVFKMRTMHPYAEYLQKYVYQKHNLQEGGKFNDDFRISSAGKIMRTLWIDELPMLINWLRGDLKLVGVRPISEHYFTLYSEEHQERRIKYKPGLVPPFYADLPKTLDEIEASENSFFDAYDKHPLRTNWRYFWKAWYNIVWKKARSK